MYRRLLAASSTALLSCHALAQSVSISPAAAPPNGASPALDPSFAGFGIEPSNLFSFTGSDVPNKFSLQLLQNLADYSGAPPHIRLGGNTQDYMIWEPSLIQPKMSPNPNSTGQGNIAADSLLIGPGYFQALDRFPKDTPVTVGLNMAYQASDWLTVITNLAQGAVSNLKNVKLYSFEIGNEPDLWLQNGFRQAPWNGQVYTNQFLDRCQAVYQHVLKPANLPSAFFESPATASTMGTSFEIAQLVNDGIMTGRNGDNYVTAWNQHDYFYFIGVTPTTLTLNDLMLLDNTNTQFAYWEKQVKLGLNTNLPYVLREMSSVGPIGMPGVSDTHGSALWTLNFFLYAATLGISSVQMHMTDNSNASAWQPIAMYGSSTTFVRPSYYAHAAVAQLIGNGNGTTQVANIKASNVGSGYDGRIRSYAIYAKNNLQSMVLINAKQANASQTNKGSFSFSVNLGAANANKDIFLSYLTAPGADSQKSVSWNRMSYNDVTGESSVVEDTFKVAKADSQGKIVVPVRDSQAIVANIGWQLGINPVLKPDGKQAKKSNAGSSCLSSPGKMLYLTMAALAAACGMAMAG